VSEERNERAVFEGVKEHSRSGVDRRKKSRRKSDMVMTVLKYLAVALLAALLAKYLG
jgi:hypothetical protein